MLIVSNYHYIREDFTSPFPSIFGMTPGQFRNQLELLAKEGKFISRNDLLNSPADSSRDKQLLITFDDGLQEQYELAKPVLDDMGIPAIFFINTANFAELKLSLVHKIHLVRSRISPHLLLQELKSSGLADLDPRELNQALLHYNYDDPETAGFKYILNFKMTVSEQEDFINPIFSQLFDEKKVARDLYFSDDSLHTLRNEDMLASHSHHHLPMGQLRTPDLEGELRATQTFFKNKFGRPADMISYPYGSHSACSGISEAVSNHGFRFGFTMERAVNTDPQRNPYLMARFDCNDLPGGKSNLFKDGDIWNHAPLSTWQSNEDNSAHRR